MVSSAHVECSAASKEKRKKGIIPYGNVFFMDDGNITVLLKRKKPPNRRRGIFFRTDRTSQENKVITLLET